MTARPQIAILSTACRFPEAASPEALWRNALEGRRAFRLMPPGRIDLSAYTEERVGLPDSITRIRAGLIADWAFDRARFRIPPSTYESVDLAHWLALEVAADAIASAAIKHLNRSRVAVVVANTLTGEFSRAALVRLRAPFLDALLADAVQDAGIEEGAGHQVRDRFLQALKEALPAPDEESLAGGLANTIAGRIANHFNFGGGAYAVDAACASSLVAVSDAAELLASGRADAVVVGAVDLSLDPFELVGFSRNGALAPDMMRVFDRRASGFWPAEGAGFAVLVRAEGAADRQGSVILRGWGVSSDGEGGLTRPTKDGQALAIRRACAAAGVDPDDLDLVEAHGTGTPIGDAVELAALASVRSGGGRALPIASIKANIGHAKAAAGFAGLLKTVECLKAGILAPHVSCEHLNPIFDDLGDRVRVPLSAERLDGRAGLAGVSSFGFGGVNAHVVVEGPRSSRPRVRRLPTRPVVQDMELFVFAAGSARALCGRFERLAARADTLALSDFADAAAQVWREAKHNRSRRWRAAIVAPGPEALIEQLARAAALAAEGTEAFDPDQGMILSSRPGRPRVGLLFPGQAAMVGAGGAWAARFGDRYGAPVALPAEGLSDTADAQPAIAAASAAGLRLLDDLGLGAEAALGHSLGELAALAWAGAIPLCDLTGLASSRGAIMSEHALREGGMAWVGLDAERGASLAEAFGLTLACQNGDRETVLAGSATALNALADRAREDGFGFERLAVSHAFHSPMMSPATRIWAQRLKGHTFSRLERPLVSSVTGSWMTSESDLRTHLVDQLESPVRFREALKALASASDLLIEVGPGHGASRLARLAGTPSVSLDVFGSSLAPALQAVGAAFALGTPIDLSTLFNDRLVRPIDLDHRPGLLTNPCSRSAQQPRPPQPLTGQPRDPPRPELNAAQPTSVRDLVFSLIAQRCELGAGELQPTHRFLVDLKLASGVVKDIVRTACERLERPLPPTHLDFAGGTIGDLVTALEGLVAFPASHGPAQRVAGAGRWIRCYGMQWRPADNNVAPAGAEIWPTVRLSGSLPDDLTDRLLVICDGAFDAAAAETLVARIGELVQRPGLQALAVLHPGWPLSGFARSVALEGRVPSVRLIECGSVDSVVQARLAEELGREVTGFHEVRFDPGGGRQSPQFVPLAPAGGAAPIGQHDVALVIGGARGGIATECAFDLASASGCALLLCGRSGPDHPEVRAVQERAAQLGVRCAHAQADATDAAALDRAVAIARERFGDVTVLIHAPAVNEPMRVEAVTSDKLRETLRPKTEGLLNAVRCTGGSLRRVVAFGSIIGRFGLAGEAHYALANAWQTALCEQIGRDNPACAVLSLEWTVWGGTGMGEDLGAVGRLALNGVDPLSVDEAVATFRDVVQRGSTGTVMLTGRFGPPPNVDVGPSPALRLAFTGKALVSFPGVELVTETALSPGRDLYLHDHRVDGRCILPGVMALEAMAQTTAALHGSHFECWEFENVRFHDFVVVRPGGTTIIRTAVLRGEDGSFHAEVRSDDDDFGQPRSSATLGAGAGIDQGRHAEPASGPGFDAEPLYGPLFFHGERFRRLQRFTLADSRGLTASLRPNANARWFSRYEPQELLLGDPGVRDAALHAIQVAAPHKRLIPVSAGRVTIQPGLAPTTVVAKEVWSDGRTYVFDVWLLNEAGEAVEVWRDATFRATGPLEAAEAMSAQPAIRPIYLERLARETLRDDSLRLVLTGANGGKDRAGRPDALQGLRLCDVFTRADGKPMRRGTGGVTLSHRDGLTLAASSDGQIACDLELSAGNAATVELCVQETLRKLGRLGDVGVRQVEAGEYTSVYAADDGCRILVASIPSDAGLLLAALGAPPQPLPMAPS